MSKRLHWLSSLVVVAVLALGTLLPAGAAPLAANSAVAVKDNLFEPKSITVNVGDKVTWTRNGKNEHTVTADDASFQSPDLDADGAAFSFTFTKPGSFAYYCKYHGAAGGKGMAGTIVVQQASASGSAPTKLPTTGGSDFGSDLFLAVGLSLLALGLVLRKRTVTVS